MWIALHSLKDKPSWVNFDNVAGISRYLGQEQKTVIYFVGDSDNYNYVKETPEEIMELMEQKNTTNATLREPGADLKKLKIKPGDR